jgi:tyrosyl-tRNA synthetase
MSCLGTEEHLMEQMRGVCGIDPTADSLHIGHLVGDVVETFSTRTNH